MFNLTPEDLRDVLYFDDAVTLLEQRSLITRTEASTLTGWPLLPGMNKYMLVSKPFLIVEYRINKGRESGNDKVDALIVTTTHDKWTLRDSSLGICEQLKDLLTRRQDEKHPNPNYNVWIKRGLRSEETEYTDYKTGVTTYPRTYYLDW